MVDDIQHKLGQYFTTNQILKDKLYEFIKNDPDCILEPSIGQGDLVKHVKSNNQNIKFDMYEIDKSIKLLDGIDKKSINYGDFMLKSMDKKYKTIIGNPPFVRTKTGNLYIDFTSKCFNLLEENGELIFIVPSDFFKLTCASKLLNKMIAEGSFTHVFHPNNENLFDNASIDVIIYRYCKNKNIEKITLYNEKKLFICNSDGLITFNEKDNSEDILVKDLFDVYVGIVSGKEEVYKNKELGNIEVLNNKDKIDKYICIDKFPCENEQINTYLESHKEELLKRRIRKFNDKNWFEWGALRNMNQVKKNVGKECIYMSNLTRKKEISFVDKVRFFGGNLIMLIPKSDINLDDIVKYFNSEDFRCNFIFSGRFKIGHRQISNSYIPKKYIK